MKILFITTQFPYPLDNGGKIGAYNGLDSLAGHEVYLLSFSEQMDRVDEGKQYLSSRWQNLHIVDVVEHDIHIQQKKIKLASVILRSYIGKLPYMAQKFYDSRMFNCIDELMKNNIFDIVFVDYLNVYQYGEYIRKKYKDRFKILCFKDHNIEYEIFKQTSEKYAGIKRILTNPIWKKTKKYEENAIRNSDVVFSVCDENTKYFRNFNDKSYTMRPTFDIVTNERRDYSSKRLLYIGNLSWGANMDGLSWFVFNVLPVIKKEIPEVKLTIAGSGGIKNPFSDKAIDWRGYVEDLNDVYSECSIFIVPLFEGSGIRIKILEAFNNEIPVVSTELACKTIGPKDRENILIANTAEEFSEAVLSLIDNNNYCKKITETAKQLLINEYSVQIRRDEITGILMTAIG